MTVRSSSFIVYQLWRNEGIKNGSSSCKHTFLLLIFKTIDEVIEIYQNSIVFINRSLFFWLLMHL